MNSSPTEILLHTLAGEWIGTGRGEYPTIDPFEYTDSIRFVIDEGVPRLLYEQKAAHRPVGAAGLTGFHWETGFLRIMPESQIELVNAQGSGRVEVLSGPFELAPDRTIIRLESVLFGNDPRMVETARTLTVDGDTLHYSLDMRTTRVAELTFHVESTLRRK